jgi:ubiquinone/menaquinone biosynthesis C-methylase UbiE
MSQNRITLAWYDQHARSFDQRTRAIDMRARLREFVELLPRGATHVLDIGCGPGRDACALAQLGYQVVGIDGSNAMIELARTKCPLATFHHMTFDQIEFDSSHDGAWANASLLHVPADQIDDVLARIARALRPAGVLYMSVKAGDGTRLHADGRFFNDYSEAALRELFARNALFDVLRIEHSPPGEGQSDRKPWLHALARKR